MRATTAPGEVPSRALAADRRVRGLMLGVATGIGLLESIKSFIANRMAGTPVGFDWAVLENLPWWYLWLLALPGIVLLRRRIPQDRSRWWWTIPVHVMAAAVIVGAHLYLYGLFHWYVLSQGVFDPSLQAQTARFFSAFYFSDLMTYGLILAVEHALTAQRRLREREVEAARLETRAARLESGLASAHLEKLRAELNPHFLFNTLNAIAGLVRRHETQTAVQMLARLGELLRASLERTTDQTVTLEVELHLLQHYLNVEIVRFRDRLTVERDIDPTVLRAHVPTLLLQPLVENAVHHGIAGVPGPGRVHLAAHRANGNLVIRIENTGPVAPVPVAREGIGLSNTRARLHELYRDGGHLQLERSDNGLAVATVTLPLSYHPTEPFDAPQ